MFTSNGYRPRTIQKLRLAADANGKLLAITHDGFSQMSQPEIGEFTESVGLASRMLYACPNISTSHRAVSVNQGLPTYMRAPGEASGNFALESGMDELAVALSIDPVELRLRNYADKDWTTGKPFASKGLRACYQQGAAAFNWASRTAAPGSMRDGRVLIGMGMATSTYPTNRMPASALVRMMPDGSVVVQSGTQDIGTGTYTTMAEIAADELGLPIERVRAELGDSRFPPAPVSGGSMTIGERVARGARRRRAGAEQNFRADGLECRRPAAGKRHGARPGRPGRRDRSDVPRRRRAARGDRRREARGGRRTTTRAMPLAPSSRRCGSIPICARSK